MSTKKIGKFIAEKRRERNYTQAQLAEMLGVTSKTISRWENGNYMPDLSMLMPLCEILGIQVEELLKGENEVAGKSREELEKEYYEKRIKEQRSQRLETIASYVFLGIFVIFVFGGGGVESRISLCVLKFQFAEGQHYALSAHSSWRW